MRTDEYDTHFVVHAVPEDATAWLAEQLCDAESPVRLFMPGFRLWDGESGMWADTEGEISGRIVRLSVGHEVVSMTVSHLGRDTGLDYTREPTMADVWPEMVRPARTMLGLLARAGAPLGLMPDDAGVLAAQA